MMTLAAAAEMWTTSEMLNAEPIPLPTVAARDEHNCQLPSLLGAEDDAEHFSPGHPPTVNSFDNTDAGGGSSTDTTAGSFPYSYPAPFTRFDVPPAWYTTYPYITVGKVFFNQGGKSYVGSAASIGNNAIWTAGHIVHAGNNQEAGWSTDMVFVPAYKDGNAPLGKWPVSFMRVRPNWYKFGNPNGLWDDMAGGVLFQQNGKKISDVVGALGIAFNVPRAQHWHAVGYPQAAPFTGQKLVDTQASYAYDGAVAGDVKPVAIGCDMTGGCSGGPWITGFLSRNLLNGNNSYRQGDRPLEMNSPYFDQRAKTLFDELVALSPT